jgi:D-glycero-alpha-D-manno-heptose-7-phosphate kinase
VLLSSRTPLRVSFFGGGTDYPEYFERHPGSVVGMAIDRYIYISTLRLTDIIDYKYRLSYSKLEKTSTRQELEHPVVRAVLDHYEVEEALDISIQSDLPAASGLGSSSAFTVGLINLITALKGISLTRLDLGRAAIHVERTLLQENVGVQDQLHAAFGGINRFDFVDGRIRITPVQMTMESLDWLTRSLVLVYTGRTRLASEAVAEQVAATREARIEQELGHLVSLSALAVDVLEGPDPEAMLKDFAALLNDAWQTKRQLSSAISSAEIDALHDAALSAGALAAKLCGAGGGGFLLTVVPPPLRTNYFEAMKGAHLVPVGMDRQGSVILRG